MSRQHLVSSTLIKAEDKLRDKIAKMRHVVAQRVWNVLLLLNEVRPKGRQAYLLAGRSSRTHPCGKPRVPNRKDAASAALVIINI
eukprot:2544426-Amphidinium_carterae.1